MNSSFLRNGLSYLATAVCIITLPACLYAQEKNAPDSITIVAGKEYGRSHLHQSIFGKHYRKDWTTPVKVPVVYLDTLAGGLTPYKAGGGRQSKSLRLTDAKGREYVLRSIDKSFGKALPEIYQGTFIEGVANDQVSIAEPYSAVTIPGMAEAAGVYHTNPRIIYIPKQKALDTFNEKFGNTLYLFEQRPDGNWKEADNFGNSKKIIGTDKLFKKLLESHKNKVDAQAFVRARLFDMFLGDWGRHEDQWRWAENKQDGKNMYEPIPRDRDQAYTKFDGLSFKLASIDYFQTFDDDIDDVETFNFPPRNLDRRLLNEVTLEDWQRAAKELQQALTDEVIEQNVRQFPPEVYTLSGADITEKLKSRRGHLLEIAEDYYKFLADEVDIPGTEDREKFVITRVNDAGTLVEIFPKSDNGFEEKPVYSRLFKTGETKRIRVYGISGNDEYLVDGHVKDGIKVRIIGGIDKDKITDNSDVGGANRKTIIYDNPGNDIHPSEETKMHISKDTAINRYVYNSFEFNKKKITPFIFYNYADRFHAGLGYKLTRHKWRKEPDFFVQSLVARYSFTQNAIGLTYKGLFYHVIRNRWDVSVIADYDAIRWTNFYGLGNETTNAGTTAFYRVRTSEFLGGITVSREFGKRHYFGIQPFYQAIQVLDDKGTFLEATESPKDNFLYTRQHFLGIGANYIYHDLNDPVVPTKGVYFSGNASFTQNITQSDKSFERYSGNLQVYVPLVSKFSLALMAGGATAQGEPEFYFDPAIGGGINFRGYKRDRFRGQTSFYNNNELQWITKFRTYLINGKIGLTALLDDGRVWQPGENSDEWHVAYGGGLIFAPYNIAKATITYAVSSDGGLVNIRVTKAF